MSEFYCPECMREVDLPHRCDVTGEVTLEDTGGNFIDSAIIGAVTDSAIIGGIAGGSLSGGMFGDLLDGDLND